MGIPGFSGISGVPGVQGPPGAPGLPGRDGCNGTDVRMLQIIFISNTYYENTAVCAFMRNSETKNENMR